jgi:hypothetical protein
MTTVSESPERLEKTTRPTEDHMDQMGDMDYEADNSHGLVFVKHSSWTQDRKA